MVGVYPEFKALMAWPMEGGAWMHNAGKFVPKNIF